MVHDDGIEVHIFDDKGKRLSEYHDPQAEHTTELRCPRRRLSQPSTEVTAHRRIVAEPRSAFELVVVLKPEFKLYGSGGVLITIGSKDSGIWNDDFGLSEPMNHNSSFWLPAAQAHGRHRFSRYGWFNHNNRFAFEQACMSFPSIRRENAPASKDCPHDWDSAPFLAV